ncbi:MAG: hypothetical protein NT069_35830, partial [Planctomycetota bacterium]|nr:hypothetical protein [Planctomycetota bacterium]
NKTLLLAKWDEQRVDSPNRPATGDSQRSSNDLGVAYKYRASATTELKSLYDAQERVVLDLAQRVRTGTTDEAGMTGSKNNLTSAVYRAFALRQQLNRVELKELEERLARSRLAIETREKIRDHVVERRVNDLLNPEFQWDDRRTTIDSAKSTRDADHPDDLTGGTVRTNESLPATTGRALIESEYRQFEGEWQIISEESAGKVTPNPRETRNRIVVNDGRMDGAEFVLNPSATPRQIDLRAEVGPKLYKSIRGIYEWVPHDQDPAAPILLRIRIPNPESKDTETRPDDFEQAGNFHTIVLERARTDPATPIPLPRVTDDVDPKLQSEYRAMDGRWRLLESSSNFEVLKVPAQPERIVTIQGEKIDEAPFSLDLSKSPRHIDLKVKSGEETKWKTVRGIYRWEESPVPKGRRLRIAMRYPALPESDSRPTDFLPTKDVHMTLLEWIGEIQPDEPARSTAPPIPDATAPSTFKTPEPANPKRP